MLLTFLRLDSTFIPMPDIATIALIEIGERSDMLTDPSLMFYMDVPYVWLASMLINLQTLISLVVDRTEGIEYRLFSMIVPVRASVQLLRQRPGP